MDIMIQDNEVAEFLMVADVARLRNVTTATVRKDILLGRLRICGLTPSGTRLFTRSEAERYARTWPSPRRSGVG